MKLLDVRNGELSSAKLNDYLDNDVLYKMVFIYTKKRFEEAPHLPAHNWRAHVHIEIRSMLLLSAKPNTQT